MARYWFKTHKKGIVWYPVSWKGWVVITLYLGGLIYYFIKDSSFFGFLIPFLILSAFLIIITYLKGESLRGS